MTAPWALLAAAGAVAFLTGLGGTAAPRTWAIFLVNLVFWSGLGITGPAVASMMELTEARWSPAVRRLALTTAGFLPVSLVLLVVLCAAGLEPLYAWVAKPVAVKAAWLNVPFFTTRTLVLAALATLLAFGLVRAVLAPPSPGEEERARTRRQRFATAFLFVWLVTVSLWGFDLVMSLDPMWYSGLFGGYVAVSALYTTFALLSILVVSAERRGLVQAGPAAVQDVAKLQFAMSIMWMYFFWSQYLVIWYGNVPLETRYLAQRFFARPWQTLAFVVFAAGWLVPFAYLLKRLTGRPPTRHRPLVAVACLGLTGIFLERVLLVFPAVSPQGGLPFGWREVLVTLGFGGLFTLSRRWFVARFQPLPALGTSPR